MIKIVRKRERQRERVKERERGVKKDKDRDTNRDIETATDRQTKTGRGEGAEVLEVFFVFETPGKRQSIGSTSVLIIFLFMIFCSVIALSMYELERP